MVIAEDPTVTYQVWAWGAGAALEDAVAPPEPEPVVEVVVDDMSVRMTASALAVASIALFAM